MKFLRNSEPMKAIASCDLVLDVSGGDSFSDIYGIKRLLAICAQKAVVTNLGVLLTLLPQTIGPFSSTPARRLAYRAMLGADDIICRDRPSKRLLTDELNLKSNVHLCPDLAFILPKDNYDVELPESFVGINVSGLLWKDSEINKRKYSAICDYRLVIDRLVQHFLSTEETDVVLIPHVTGENSFDSDTGISRRLAEEWNHPRLHTIPICGKPQQMKSVLSRAEFFIGSRMHACIGALSQCRPTACLSYSRKFSGVMELVQNSTLSVEDFVFDLNTLSTDEVFDRTVSLYTKRAQLERELQQSIPMLQSEIWDLFKEQVRLGAR